MATRPVYIVNNNNYIEKKIIEFEWIKGMHISRKLLCSKSLQKSASEELQIDISNFLEISSCADIELGKNLSAFNLKTNFENSDKIYSVESAFQSSKVFQNGGPYKELIHSNSKDAKKDPRIKNSGELLHFEFMGKKIDADGTTIFYDWLYINVLLKNTDLHKSILKYRVFTDIAFNPQKMLNTQAFSIALFVALKLKNIDMSDFRNFEVFKEVTKEFYQKITFGDGKLL